MTTAVQPDPAPGPQAVAPPTIAPRRAPIRRPGQPIRALARCAHCEAPATISNSAEITILHRVIYFRCSNDQCGHCWRASLAFEHSIAVPVRPRPGLQLPTTPRARVAGPPAAPDPPGPANDG